MVEWGGMVSAGAPFPDPATERVRVELERQAATLVVVVARVAGAAMLAPVPTTAEWRGPARRAYDLALEELRATLSTAGFAVDSALADTRRAIAGLGADGR